VSTHIVQHVLGGETASPRRREFPVAPFCFAAIIELLFFGNDIRTPLCAVAPRHEV
jgi:hypothetical protein